MKLSRRIAQNLLTIGAVTLSPKEYYTWVSGIKSPIYCDNRITISYPGVRKTITQGFVDHIKEVYPETEAIVGTATAGIPQAAWVSDALNLPMAYVRTNNKEHGKGQKIEGHLKENSKVIVIEDLISSGKSSIEVCQALQEDGYEVLEVCSIFTYELSRANEAFSKNQIKTYSLSNYPELIQTAKENNLIAQEDLELLNQWNTSL